MIASAFPGLFRLVDFQAMDLRDLIVWSKLAEATARTRRIEAATVGRAAMATEDSFAAWVGEERFHLAELRHGPEAVTAASFEAFTRHVRQRGG